MARYVLSKDNDKIILTDTKTGKKRTLSIDDIDYVVDDNQKLRDENTISTYFRLKEEDFKPKTITKKANLVQEYKEAKKYDKSDINSTDPMLDFINKFNLTSLERAALIQMPYKETIRKFERPESEKNIILNDFQRVTEKIIEKGIKNTEEYIKNYLTKYNNEHPITIDDLFLIRSNYVTDNDYEKIKKYIKDGNRINNLDDLYKQGIKIFKGIYLGCLNTIFNNYQKAKTIIENINKNNSYKINVKENIILHDNQWWCFRYDLTSNTIINNNYFTMKAYNLIFDKIFIDNEELLKTIYNEGLKFFNNINKIILLSKQIMKVGFNRKIEEIYNYHYQLGVTINKEYTAVYPTNNFTTREMIKSYIKIDNFAKLLGKESDDTLLNIVFSTFQNLYMGFLSPWPRNYVGFGAGENLAGSWTDKTLTRIDVIIDTLKGMGIGMGWSDKTLSRIDKIISQLKGMGDEIAGGWTDKTLNRIEIIIDTLKGMGNGVILTDKDIEYY